LLWGRTVRHLFGERDRIDPGGLLRPRVAFRRIGLLALDTLAASGINDGLLRLCCKYEREHRQANPVSNNSLHGSKSHKSFATSCPLE
jgi:hypothetical protein